LILRFERDFPDAKVVKLERNYRSTQPILDAAFRIVSQNRVRAPKRLWTDRVQGIPVTLTPVSDEEEEARLIAEYIQRQSIWDGDATAITPSSTARTRSHASSRSDSCANASHTASWAHSASTIAKRLKTCWLICVWWSIPTMR
jgi:superfamily I DNA/RNA helicase